MSPFACVLASDTLPPAVTPSLPPAWMVPCELTSPLACRVKSVTPRCAPVMVTSPLAWIVTCCCAAVPATARSPFDDSVRSPALAASCASARTPMPAAVLITWICPAVIAPNAVASIAWPLALAPAMAASVLSAPFAEVA